MIKKDFTANKDFEIPFGFEVATFEDLSNTKLPSKFEFNEWKWLLDRKLIINNDITEDLVTLGNYIIEWNMEDVGKSQEEKKPIYIYLYSYGGDLNSANCFIDILKLSKTPIKIINMGQACSAAALIFMAKTEYIERIMLPNARVLIHQGQVNIGGQTNQVLDITKDIQKSENKIKQYVLENTKIDPKIYDKKRRVEWALYAEYSLKFGVCDKIVKDIDEIY